MHIHSAIAYLPSFCIDLRVDHLFNTFSCILHVEPAGNYQARFYWHDGEGRLTLDPVSSRTADSSLRKSISHPFAYHGLPYMLHPVFLTCYRRTKYNIPDILHTMGYALNAVGRFAKDPIYAEAGGRYK